MAGDWIKMRTDLDEDPAVIAMARQLSIDEFAVVGRLHKFWSWTDRQSRDGHAAGVTASWLNRFVQRDGFAEAMVSVAWLVLDEHGLSVPNFERHNGETAKARALTTDRKRREREQKVTPLSRSQRDDIVTREEKRREEKKTSMSGSSNPDGGEDVPGDLKAAAEFWNSMVVPTWKKPAIRSKTLAELAKKYTSIAAHMRAAGYADWTLEAALRRAFATLPGLAGATWFRFKDALFEHNYLEKNERLWTGYYASIHGAAEPRKPQARPIRVVPFGQP